MPASSNPNASSNHGPKVTNTHWLEAVRLNIVTTINQAERGVAPAASRAACRSVCGSSGPRRRPTTIAITATIRAPSA